MPNLGEEYDDDISIVKVTPSLCEDEMETEYSFVLTQKYILPGMSESQQLSDSPQKQLQEILKENNELRDALTKNNLDIRQLLASFRDFQEKTHQSRSIHKQKIDSMWKEKQELQMDKEKMLIQFQELQEKLNNQTQAFEKVKTALSGAEKTCSDHETELKNLREELKRSELIVLTTSSQMKELEVEVAQLKLEREKISNQNEALVQQLEKQSSAFKEQLAASELRNQTNESALHLLREDHQQQQSQLLKLNGELEKLTCENQALLEKMEADNSLLEEERSSAKEQCVELANRLESMQRHKSEHETSELQAKSELEESQKQVADLQARVEELEEHKSKLMQHLQGMQQLQVHGEDEMGFSFVNSLTDISLQRRLNEEELRCSELTQTVTEQREQLEKLEKELETKKLISIQDAEIAERFFQNQNPSNFSTAILQHYEQFEDRCQSLGEQLGACQQRLQFLKLEDSSAALQDGLKKEIEVLKQLLEQERQDKVSEKKILEERVEQLSNNYRQILASWEIYEADQKTKGRQNEALTAIEKRQHQEKLDELMAQKVGLEEETQAKDRELNALKGQISLLTRETEQVPILRAQVELYRQDFIKERDEKAKKDASVELLKQEITVLHSQLSEVRDELNIVHEQQRQELNYHHEQQQRLEQNQEPPRVETSNNEEEEPQATAPAPVEEFIMPQSKRVIIQSYKPPVSDSRRNRRSHHHRSSSPPPDSLPSFNSRNSYECPRCKMCYSTVSAVENHLEGCLREDGPYP